MTTSQIILYALMALVAALYLRRWLLLRGMKQYSPRELAEAMKHSGSKVLLDVRTASERQGNSIKGSIHIPLHELGSRIDELTKHKNKEVICFCQSGNRSLSAAARLKRLGFTAANLKGGIAEWNSSGQR